MLFDKPHRPRWQTGGKRLPLLISISNRRQHRKYRKRYPEKARAQWKVANALRQGKIKKLPCEICGSIKTDAHHDNYLDALNVRWFCRLHHMRQFHCGTHG